MTTPGFTTVEVSSKFSPWSIQTTQPNQNYFAVFKACNSASSSLLWLLIVFISLSILINSFSAVVKTVLKVPRL